MSLPSTDPTGTDPTGTSPTSSPPPRILSLSSTCTLSGSLIEFTVVKGVRSSVVAVALLLPNGTAIWSDSIESAVSSKGFSIEGTPDGSYRLTASSPDATAEEPVEVSCGNVSSPDALKLGIGHTDETATAEGTITLTPTGGTDPITVEVVDLSLSQATTAGTAKAFDNIPPTTYQVRATDSSSPAQVVTSSVTVLAYSAPVTGCQDEYALNFDPLATSAGSCDYGPAWRSAWGPGAVPVRVPALASQIEAYTVAELRIGFRPGHPLAAQRPLGDAVKLRATIGPDGYATFRLGPYLQRALGSDDGAGGFRLDINTETPDDLYCGYELRRAVSDELLDHGYFLNAARPDGELVEGQVLSSFARLPVWPGYEWTRQKLSSQSTGRYGALADAAPGNVYLTCPSNPLPVAWLNPWGGFDYWVFQGRPQLGDDVGEGQTFTEAATGQRRYSEPGAAFETFKATSGVFRGDDLVAGLRTLWRSPQAWVQLERGGEWLPILVERGSRDVGRMGVARQEVAISFSLATAEYAQGQ
jgi:hypothetical protein